MKTETQVFRGYGKRKEIHAQTAVECRFGQEVETILAAHCSAALTGAEAGNGEVRYFGKARFSLVYEDAEKKVCRAEKGVEFSAVAKDDFCFPALSARALLSVENIAVRREGASVFAQALLGADIALYGEQSFEYLSGGDLIMRREPVKVLSAHLVSGAAETEDEFETEFIGDILQHAETVNLSEIVCETGTLKLEGEVSLGILALKPSGALVSFERLIPFEIAIPCDFASYGCSAEAHVSVMNVSIHAEADEERNKCRIFAEITLSAEGSVYEETAVDAVTDAFSPTHNATLTFATAESGGVGDVVSLTERVAGKCALSSPIAFSDVLQAVTLQRAEASLVSTEEGKRVEGVAMATLIIADAEGGHRGVELSLPFSVPVDAKDAAVTVVVCGMSARQRQEGEIDAEATLKITLQEKRVLSARLVANAEEGERLLMSESAVSVYIPRAGDGLWELAKSLKKSPEEVSASNPDIEFPVKEGQRVIVYRKKSLVR